MLCIGGDVHMPATSNLHAEGLSVMAQGCCNQHPGISFAACNLYNMHPTAVAAAIRAVVITIALSSLCLPINLCCMHA